MIAVFYFIISFFNIFIKKNGTYEGKLKIQEPKMNKMD